MLALREEIIVTKQRLHALASLAIGFVLALALVELAATAWLYVEDGHHTPAAKLFERTRNTYVRDLTPDSGCRFVDTLFPHPYLAFVHHGNPPCGATNVNDIGLFNDDFQVVKPTDRYVVLLTGGSVASNLGQTGAPPAPRFLEEELNRRYVSPDGRPFLVLNGAAGAWKQPQQLILFSLYATSVDAVVTLDGYNEHYYFRTGVPSRLEAPASSFLEVNPFVAGERFGDAATGWLIGRVVGGLARNPLLGHSHAAYLVIRRLEAFARSQERFGTNARTSFAGMFRLPEDVRTDGERLFAVQMDLYRKYARGIEAIARDHGVRTAYFLQPVPAWGKTLSPEEKAAVGDLSYGPVYRRIVDGMLALRERGLPVYDLGDLLVDQPGTLYADHIHFAHELRGESRGYRLLAARMGERLADAWGLRRKS